MTIQDIFTSAPWLNVSKTAEEIGINPGLMRRYVCGEVEPSKTQKKKILHGLQRISYSIYNLISDVMKDEDIIIDDEFNEYKFPYKKDKKD